MNSSIMANELDARASVADVDAMFSHPDIAGGKLSAEEEAQMLTSMLYKKYVGRDEDKAQLANEASSIIATINEEAHTRIGVPGGSNEPGEVLTSPERDRKAADLHKSLEMLNMRMDEQMASFKRKQERGSFRSSNQNDSLRQEQRRAKRERNRSLGDISSPSQSRPNTAASGTTRQSSHDDSHVDYLESLGFSKKDRLLLMTPITAESPSPSRPGTSGPSSRGFDRQRSQSAKSGKLNAQFSYNSATQAPPRSARLSQGSSGSSGYRDTGGPSRAGSDVAVTPGSAGGWGEVESRGRRALRVSNFPLFDGGHSSGRYTDDRDRAATIGARQSPTRGRMPSNSNEYGYQPRQRSLSPGRRRKTLPHRPMSRDVLGAQQQQSESPRSAAPPRSASNQIPGQISSPPVYSPSMPGGPERTPPAVAVPPPTAATKLPSQQAVGQWVDPKQTKPTTTKTLALPVAAAKKAPLLGDVMHMTTHDLPKSAPMASAALLQQAQGGGGNHTKGKESKLKKSRFWRKKSKDGGINKRDIGLPEGFVHVSHTAPSDVGPLLSALQAAELADPAEIALAAQTVQTSQLTEANELGVSSC